MTNSNTPSRFGRFAIENDRTSPVSGTVRSMYWPGKNLMSSPAICLTTRWRMSWVTASLASTSTVPFRSGRPDRMISSS